MKDRIRQLMDDKAMSQKTFASELCIAEATLSGIFNGRTRPTNQTVSAIHEKFPEVNISWLMFGEGDMYVPSSGSIAGADNSADHSDSVPIAADRQYVSDASGQLDLFAGQEAVVSATATSGVTRHVHVAQPTSVGQQVRVIEKYVDKPQRRITEIRIFFDDGTYETFSK